MQIGFRASGFIGLKFSETIYFNAFRVSFKNICQELHQMAQIYSTLSINPQKYGFGSND